ncbi:MAG: GtrA family protein [Synergistes sp.]|nr:GtrA family protein [Synergistes sp.]
MKQGNTVKQFSQYLIVGGIATVVEWACFYILNSLCALHYMPSTALAFIISTFSNWLAGKLIMFKERKAIIPELIKIYLTSIAGLVFNIIIMWVVVEKVGMIEMHGKIIATGIVFLWNFFVRKLLIYKI